VGSLTIASEKMTPVFATLSTNLWWTIGVLSVLVVCAVLFIWLRNDEHAEEDDELIQQKQPPPPGKRPPHEPFDLEQRLTAHEKALRAKERDK
jgi:hypothetical protein